MARRFRGIDDYERHLRHKYGIGSREKYKPWFNVKDVKNNKAFRKEIKGLTVPREHHLLSALEYELLLIMDFRQDVVDIREQFPLLPLSLTRKIAHIFDVDHPKVVGATVATPFVMTTDMLVTFNSFGDDKYAAFCVKSESELANLRTLEKIEIERAWWEALGVSFKMFSGNERTKIQSHNILWATDIHRHGLDETLSSYTKEALQMIPEGLSLKCAVCDELAKRFHLDAVDALNLLRMLIGKRMIDVDLGRQYLDKAETIIVTRNPHYLAECSYVSGG